MMFPLLIVTKHLACVSSLGSIFSAPFISLRGIPSIFSERPSAALSSLTNTLFADHFLSLLYYIADALQHSYARLSCLLSKSKISWRDIVSDYRSTNTSVDGRAFGDIVYCSYSSTSLLMIQKLFSMRVTYPRFFCAIKRSCTVILHQFIHNKTAIDSSQRHAVL